MRIVEYPHPALRHVSKSIKRVDGELRDIVREMFEIMYEAKGVGLAANQVELPLRLFVCNVESDPAAKDLEQVFINPVIGERKGTAEAEEGCLSIPGFYAPVKRAERINVTAYNLSGQKFDGEIDDLYARVVQHETDHLDGILFTDRLSTTGTMEAREVLEEFEYKFQSARERNEISSDEAIKRRLAEFEAKYC
ncbi:MAG: peptide deformylase [Pirellulales bacterium]